MKKILKRILPAIYITVITFIAAIIIGVIYIKVTNLITLDRVDSLALEVTSEVAKNSTPIVVDNIVLGAVYNSYFITGNRYNSDSTNKEETSIDMYSNTLKIGTASITGVYTSSYITSPYITTDRYAYTKEFLGGAEGKISLTAINSVEITDEVQKEYSKYVKKALGIYYFINSTVKIQEVYEFLNIENSTYDKLIVATNSRK